MTEKTDLLITNNWHPAMIEKLDQLYRTHKLWETGGVNAQMQLLVKIAVLCEAITTQGFINDDFRKAIPFPIINGDFMDALPRLKIIANFGVGYDTIDA